MPRIMLEKVTMQFGDIYAVKDIDLVVRDGEYLTVLGPSGCGKTSLIKVISGIWTPSSGRVLIDGEDVTPIPIEDRNVGYVFQNIALFPHMEVLKNVSYGPLMRDMPLDERNAVAEKYLQLVKMLDKMGMLPGELSSGEQQKVAISRALASGSNLLLLDEPLSALDARVRMELRYEIRRLVKDLGITVVHVTHDQDEAMSVSDRIVVMRNGGIVETDTPMALYRRPNNLFTAYFIGETNLIEGMVSDKNAHNIVVRLRDGTDVKVNGNRHFNIDDAVVLSVRPEYVYTAKEGLTAKVTQVIYMGSYWRVIARAESMDMVEYNIQRYENPPAIGSDVNLVFNPKMLMVYKRPTEGISEAIRLE